MYKFQEKIDGERGGFADVWTALDPDSGKVVAVKVLRDFRSADARRRFEREVRILCSLRHSGIVPLLGYNLNVEQPFYVMPYMRWGCLTSWAGKLSPEHVRRVFRRLVSVLAYLHSRGTLHRDIKPDNVLVDGNGNFTVGDFGLGNDPRCTVIFTVNAVGTPGYVAPELINGWGAASQASDMYSLGATLFHLITGVHPRDAQSLDVWTIRRDVPEDLRNIVLQLSSPVPLSRPTARQLTAANPPEAEDEARIPAKPIDWGAVVGGVLAAGAIFLLVGAAASALGKAARS